jgi:site-specific recombinase XerD
MVLRDVCPRCKSPKYKKHGHIHTGKQHHQGKHWGRQFVQGFAQSRSSDDTRALEAVSLRWEAVDLQAGCLHVHRIKHGHPAVHPLRGPELRALRQVRRDYPDAPYLFVSERGGPLTARAVRHIVLRAGEVAGLTFPIHPHMLRHACGVSLANKGIDTRAIQQYLGHCNIQHTVRYTALTPHRFTDFWRD